MYGILCILAVGAMKTSEAYYSFIEIEPLSCGEDQFQCHVSKECISKSMRCDSKRDCSDASDELDCDIYLCTPPNWFKCRNNECISHALVCDGENDCRDYSDELKCEDFEKCSKDEWQCEDKLCIMESWVCNGEEDCADGTDETIGCTDKNTTRCGDGHMCETGNCIPKEWICDGHSDCEDNSDEHNCNPARCELEDRRYRCKDNATCVDTVQLCDKKKDCPDGSDEGNFCLTTSCAHKNCSHDCVMTPSGPICLCPIGYHKYSESMCQDINECEQYGICDQKCRNTPGSYECYCDKMYKLGKDKKSCRAEGGESLMVFSSKTEIRGYFLETDVYYPIARKLKQVVGVAFDGRHVYWTNIFSEHESIVRSLDDGTQRQLLVTSGLGAPEDLAIDWVTGNIYFTDSEYMHIGVCCNDGVHCSVIVNEDIHKPRGIVLNPASGEMFWSDWGKQAKIAKAFMDGTHDMVFVSENIFWPNGLTIDYPNERLYWTDAKSQTLESIRLDGTDRRVVLGEVVKHPYAIAVFEDRLYWSDWNSHSIQSCDKFTGRNLHTLVKERKELIYGLHIFHPAMKQRLNNPCVNAYCSDFCVLSGQTYACLCPQNKEMSRDNHTCREVQKKLILIGSVGDSLIRIQHQLLGKHEIVTLPLSPALKLEDITELVYDSVNGSLIAYDAKSGDVLSLDLETGEGTVLLRRETLGRISGMDLDYLANNLYFADFEKGTVEVLALATMHRMLLLHNMGAERPVDICLLPEDGVMFVAAQRADGGVHIDRMLMDGTGRTHMVENGLSSSIRLHYDSDLERIFWADTDTGVIESTNRDTDDRHMFRALKTEPVSITTLGNDMFWTVKNGKQIYWADKFNLGAESNRKITLDVPASNISLVAVTGKRVDSFVCHAGCSHLCLLSGKQTVCGCPRGWILKPDRKECAKPLRCERDQYKCEQSDACINNVLRCDGKQDCEKGEDEMHCPPKGSEHPAFCAMDQFRCSDGECIMKEYRCDFHVDCKDKSDEEDCQGERAAEPGCPPGTIQCDGDSCLSERFVCDGQRDCVHGEDEENCAAKTCGPEQFQCAVGNCIPSNWECDLEFDCPDSSDEHESCRQRDCTSDPKRFRCENGVCIDVTFVCDGVDDCGDHTDESRCKEVPVKVKNITCPSDSFLCASRNVCLPESARCNRSVECPPGEDEFHCNHAPNATTRCLVEEFECANGNCVNGLWLCDRRDDCGDGSDEMEQLCRGTGGVGPSEVARLKSAVDCEHGYRCKSGHCIDMQLVCDGVENCYDGSDEQGSCATSCNPHRNPCSEKCIKTPMGPKCACSEGYQLMGDGKTCEDVKECLMEPSPCSQECSETPGSFTCSCFPGFVDRGDRRSCKAKGVPMSIFFTLSNLAEIRRLSQATHSLEVISKLEGPPISDLIVSVEQELLYFSWPELGIIYRQNLRNLTHDYIADLHRPTKLALDWVTHNIYYADSATSSRRSIYVCNYEQKNCAKIITLDSNGEISDLVVDGKNKYIFYSVRTWWMLNSATSSVFRANLDGSRPQEIMKSEAGYVNGLAIDFHRRRLYTTDEVHEVIHRLQYDGSNRTVVLHNVTRPRGLSLYEDHLYFFQPNGFMKKCKLYGMSAQLQCDIFRISSENIEHFTIMQASLQPYIVNSCEKHSCRGICIQNDIGIQCICPDGKNVKEDIECASTSILNPFGDGVHPKFISNVPTTATNSKSRGSGSVIVGVVIFFLILVVAGGVFYIKKRYSPSTLMDVSAVRFINPVYGLSGAKDSSETSLLPGQHEYCNPIDVTCKNNNILLVKEVDGYMEDHDTHEGKKFVL